MYIYHFEYKHILYTDDKRKYVLFVWQCLSYWKVKQCHKNIKKKKNMFSLSHRIRMLFKKVIHIQFECNFLKITLNGGSLGSWVDEERSKLRVNL